MEEFIFSISLSAHELNGGAGGFNLSRSDLHNTDRWTQVIELAYAEWKKEEKKKMNSKVN